MRRQGWCRWRDLPGQRRRLWRRLRLQYGQEREYMLWHVMRRVRGRSCHLLRSLGIMRRQGWCRWRDSPGQRRRLRRRQRVQRVSKQPVLCWSNVRCQRCRSTHLLYGQECNVWRSIPSWRWHIQRGRGYRRRLRRELHLQYVFEQEHMLCWDGMRCVRGRSFHLLRSL